MLESFRELPKVAGFVAGLTLAGGCAGQMNRPNPVMKPVPRIEASDRIGLDQVEGIREDCEHEYEQALFVTKMHPSHVIAACIRKKCAEQCRGAHAQCAIQCEREEGIR